MNSSTSQSKSAQQSTEQTNQEAHSISTNVLTWFFVTKPVIRNGQKYNGKPLSPNFRTLQEADTFRAENGLDDSLICQQGLLIRNEGRRMEMEAILFDGKIPGTAVGYMPEQQA